MSKTILKVPLEYLQTDLSGIPSFLPLVCNFLTKNAKTEGLFRKCGNHEDIIQLNDSLASYNPLIPDNMSPHDVASLLKLWLNQLPDPLIPPDLINSLMRTEGKISKSLLEKMPPLARRCFRANLLCPERSCSLF